MKSAYLRIDDSVINKPRKEKMDGVKVTVMLSPFDVPDSLFFDEDEDTKALHFKFKYFGSNEPSHVFQPDDNSNIKLVLGKRSHRVYEIILDPVDTVEENGLNIRQLQERVENILGDYVSGHPDRKSGSFDAVKNVLHNYEDQLASLAQATRLRLGEKSGGSLWGSRHNRPGRRYSGG